MPAPIATGINVAATATAIRTAGTAFHSKSTGGHHHGCDAGSEGQPLHLLPLVPDRATEPQTQRDDREHE